MGPQHIHGLKQQKIVMHDCNYTTLNRLPLKGLTVPQKCHDFRENSFKFISIPLSSIFVLPYILIFSIYWPDISFYLLLWLEGQHPQVASSLLTVILIFCRYIFYSSQMRTSEGLPLLSLFWLELVCAVLRGEQYTVLYEVSSFLAISHTH